MSEKRKIERQREMPLIVIYLLTYLEVWINSNTWRFSANFDKFFKSASCFKKMFEPICEFFFLHSQSLQFWNFKSLWFLILLMMPLRGMCSRFAMRSCFLHISKEVLIWRTLQENQNLPLHTQANLTLTTRNTQNLSREKQNQAHKRIWM